MRPHCNDKLCWQQFLFHRPHRNPWVIGNLERLSSRQWSWQCHLGELIHHNPIIPTICMHEHFIDYLHGTKSWISHILYIYSVYSLALVLLLCKPRVIDLLMRFRASIWSIPTMFYQTLTVDMCLNNICNGLRNTFGVSPDETYIDKAVMEMEA
jgi:hypothetical protein